MTYLSFHFIFTIPVFLVLSLISFFKTPKFNKKALFGTGLLIFLAVSYTTPWDSYLIKENIWAYPPSRVLGTFLYIPFEEYFFFIIQTVIGCLFTFQILNHPPFHSDQTSSPSWLYYSVAAMLLFIFTITIGQVSTPSPHRYLALIMAWSTPIVLLQWLIGYNTLWRHRLTYLFCIAIQTSFFCFADWIAVKNGIWFFSEKQVTHINFFTFLPIEEAIFFLMTNIMVVQGFILFTRMPLQLGRLKLNHE